MRWIVVICIAILCTAAVASYAQETKPEKAYTSLVIDAKGLDLERSISPKICKEDESVIWGDSEVTTDYAIEHGVVAYVHSLDDAEKSSRCGANPLIIKAIKCADGIIKSNPIVSDSDAELLLSENKKGKYLDEYKVIFVVD